MKNLIYIVFIFAIFGCKINQNIFYQPKGYSFFHIENYNSKDGIHPFFIKENYVTFEEFNEVLNHNFDLLTQKEKELVSNQNKLFKLKLKNQPVVGLSEEIIEIYLRNLQKIISKKQNKSVKFVVEIPSFKERSIYFNSNNLDEDSLIYTKENLTLITSKSVYLRPIIKHLF
jgi:hypothetical protein